MYHLILVGVLFSGGNYTIGEHYFDSKAECLNTIIKSNENLHRDLRACQFSEGNWFRSGDNIVYCSKIKDTKEVIGKCALEN